MGNALPPSPLPPPDYANSREFTLWAKYEDIAKHFNDLIMKLRTQALGGLAGVIAISGLAINFSGKPSSNTEWQILFGTILFFTLAWVALWVLDLGYYNKLLLGAVEAIREHEDSTHQEGVNPSASNAIILSTRISAAAPRHQRFVIGFYVLVLIGLFTGLIYTGAQSLLEIKADAKDNLEFRFDRAKTDKLQLTVEPRVDTTSALPSTAPDLKLPSQSGPQGSGKK